MINKLMRQMSLKEKVGQLNQRLYGWQIFSKENDEIKLTDIFKQEVEHFSGIGFIYGAFRSDPWSRIHFQNGLTKEESRMLVQIVQQFIKENTRLGIPVLFTEECPHGHQGLYSTTFPVNYTVGSSWNTELYQKAQEIVASEIREAGAHIGLISTLDVSRDPRWGRTEECFSEDPFLTGKFTQAALRGLQGDATSIISENKVIATLKHFAAQGATMGGHNAGPTAIGERELFEIHLLPMLYAIEAQAEICMAAYNDIDGIPCHGNKHLFQTVLREKMKYQGLVMSDGVALERLVSLVHGDRALAAAWALDSGININLWDNVFPYLEEAVQKKYIDIEKIDSSVYRILKMKEKMGLFENDSSTFKGYTSEYKKKINKQLSQESMVLLKNDFDILPLTLKKIKKIAVIGPNANEIYNQLGDYTPYKDEKTISTVYRGIKKYVENKVEVSYAKGCDISLGAKNQLAEAIQLAKEADYVILVLGGSSARDFSTVFDINGAALSGSQEMTSGENIDLSDIEISHSQQELVHKIYEINNNIIGVLVQGRPHTIASIEEKMKAIFNIGYPGECAGEAFAELLFGVVSPSGKLAMSIANSVGELPVFYNYKDNHHQYQYADVKRKRSYSFGYGLSYSTFEMREVMIKKHHEKNSILEISGKIKNTGSIDAKEVIQVYIIASHEKTIPRTKQLKGFEKIFVKSKEESEFKIHLSENELSGLTYDMNYKMYNQVKVIIEIQGQSFEEEVCLKEIK